MLAFVYHGPEDLRVESVPDPEPGPGEAVVRVRACGICGTDLRIAKGGHRAYAGVRQRIPGHEIAGEIAALGEHTDGLRRGQPVFIAPNIGCGRCTSCHARRPNLCENLAAFGITFDGAFAEYVRVPAAAVSGGNLLPLPDGLDPATVSVIEPLACVLRGARACATGERDSVLIFGAGPIGLLHLMVARALGAGQVMVSEPSRTRREQALVFGADAVIDPGAESVEDVVRDRTDGRGPDVVVTAAPVGAVQRQAVELAAVGGRVNFFGGLPAQNSRVELDTNLVHYRELVLTGTTGNDVDDCREALELVLTGRVDASRLVSARHPLEDAQRALVEAGAGDALKVVIQP